jgi:hypothetical protein
VIFIGDVPKVEQELAIQHSYTLADEFLKVQWVPVTSMQTLNREMM